MLKQRAGRLYSLVSLALFLSSLACRTPAADAKSLCDFAETWESEGKPTGAGATALLDAFLEQRPHRIIRQIVEATRSAVPDQRYLLLVGSMRDDNHPMYTAGVRGWECPALRRVLAYGEPGQASWDWFMAIGIFDEVTRGSDETPEAQKAAFNQRLRAEIRSPEVRDLLDGPAETRRERWQALAAAENVQYVSWDWADKVFALLD